MACCYIAAFCVGQLVKACHFFDFDDGITYNDDLSAPRQAGSMAETANNRFKESRVSNSITLSLEGLTCAACVQAVESALLRVQGVRDARVSLKLQQATVICDRGDERALDPSMLVHAVQDAGYKAELGQRPRAETIKVLMATKEIKELKMTCYKILKYSSAVNVFQWGLYWLSHGWLGPPWAGILAWMLSLSSIVASLYCQYRHVSQLHREAWRLIKSWTANMNTLILLSTGLGFLISILDLAVRGPLLASSYETTTLGLILVVKMGRLLDLLSQRQASRNLVGLVRLSSKMEQVILYPDNKRLPASFVRAGDQVVIEPFTVVPCDCYIAVGASQVNESIMTGESIPIDKSTGDFLLAGTRNLQGSLICTVHKECGYSFYDQLVDGVTEAMAGKLDSYRYLDAIIKHFIIGVVIAATVIPIFVFYCTFEPQLPLADCLIALAKRAMTILMRHSRKGF
ncbi:hypothetical protein CLAIMM_13845 [Cladophialophora immunda]|nr:hypothetical protein CLAIMM_13845 [Cladophialophora immunda]